MKNKTPFKLGQNPTTERAKPRSVQRVVEDQQLRHLLHDLVDRICIYASEPANWPLTQQEQIAFVRETINKARRIQKLEAYLADTMKLTAEELAMQS